MKTEDNKVEKILSRRNYDHNLSKKLYDSIDSGMTLNKLSKSMSPGALTTSFHGMSMIAKQFSDVYFANEHECDLELAQYATKHCKMAIISNDTDFLIFAGQWKLWSAEIKIKDNHTMSIYKQMKKTTMRRETIEYNRNAISNICSLSQHQLPLLATILGNDITEIYNKRLTEICKKVDPNGSTMKNAASIVQKIYASNAKNMDIKCIVQQIFCQTSDEKEQVIQQSLDSYNINFTKKIIDNPLEKRLFSTNIYQYYMETLGSTIIIGMPFYDMRGCEDSSTLPSLLIDWAKRKVGVLRQKKQRIYIYGVGEKKFRRDL